MVDNVGKDNLITPSSAVSERAKPSPSPHKKRGPSFTDALEKAQGQFKIKISAHARERMENRRIELGEADLREISEAVERAGNKGARSSLLLYGDVALVASVVNRTIVTAIDETEAREHIFTGIDSAVIVK